jgi:hypothetical protein
MNEHVCGLCKTSINPGAYVCVGCQGTVVYGASNAEIETAVKFGGGIGFFVVLFSWAHFWGFSLHTLIAGAVGAGVGAWIATTIARNARAGQVRTFRHL